MSTNVNNSPMANRKENIHFFLTSSIANPFNSPLANFLFKPKSYLKIFI